MIGATEQQIRKAADIVQQGGIILFPTDTAFGIGCRIDDTDAVDRLFSLRKRPRFQATPVLVDSVKMASAYFRSPTGTVDKLMKRYWPGALTIVAPCRRDTVYEPVRGGSDTIGLRMPNHSTPIGVIRRIGVPMLGPSANFHGDATPYAFEDLNPELIALVDYVLPGECPVKQASTVVDCSADPYVILRQGSVRLS